MSNNTHHAKVEIRKLTADDHHYAEMQLTNGKHLKWLSKADYESIARIDNPSTYKPHDKLRQFIQVSGEHIAVKPRKNYTEELQELNAKMDRILALVEAK